MNLKSIRWKLSLTYAGIALVTALAMGAVLLLTLRGYYSSQEHFYLEKNARSVSLAIAPLLLSENPPEELGMHIKLLSFLSQIRVQLMDTEGRMVVDSGSPGQDSPLMVSALSESVRAQVDPRLSGDQSNSVPAGQAMPAIQDQVFIAKEPEGQYLFSLGISKSEPADVEKTTIDLPSPASREKLQFFYRQTNDVLGSDSIEVAALEKQDGETSGRTLVAVIPASGTMYGFDLQPNSVSDDERSIQIVRQIIMSPEGKPLGTLTVSDGPAIGSEIIAGVARGGVVAALAAVGIAAAAGWWVSRRMSAPLTELTGSARQMSTGDLSVRASVTSKDEFGNLATAFNDMADRVQEIVGSLRSFASDAAHELQTPLTALNTNLELAAQENPESSYLSQARQQFRRLETLAANLLDLSRIESGDSIEAPGAPMETVDIRSLLQSIGERYASEAEQARKMFYLEVPDQAILVAGHPDRLRRAITNLLDNALKFTPPGGMIEAGLMQEDGLVKIWVEDNGIGVPAEDQPRLFQRFHRGQNVSVFPGSGLGLAIVQAIVEKHCGLVRYEALTRGSKFWIELPLAVY
jgi:signal transduction histidine kinase